MFIAVLHLFLTVPVSAAAPSVINLDKAGARVEFLAIGSPSAIKIRGKLSGDKPPLSGVLRLDGASLSGSAVVLLDGFDTGMELRNRHMKEKYLETRKWPTTELVLAKLTLPESCAVGDCVASGIPLEGSLSLHGSKQTVTGLVAIKKTGGQMEAGFEFKFPLSDFGIETPSFMGISVTQAVTVTVAVNGTLE